MSIVALELILYLWKVIPHNTAHRKYKFKSFQSLEIKCHQNDTYADVLSIVYLSYILNATRILNVAFFSFSDRELEINISVLAAVLIFLDLVKLSQEFQVPLVEF